MHALYEQLVRFAAEVAVMAVTILLMRVRNQIARRRKRHAPIEQLHRHDLRISEALDRVRILTRASRVYVSLYRNGEYFDSGNPLLRKTRLYERCDPNVTSQLDKYRDMLVSRIPDEFTLVKEPGHSFTAVAALPEGNFRGLCEGEGTAAVARVALRRGDRFLGFVGADYPTETEPPAMDELEKCARIVATELSCTAKTDL